MSATKVVVVAFEKKWISLSHCVSLSGLHESAVAVTRRRKPLWVWAHPLLSFYLLSLSLHFLEIRFHPNWLKIDCCPSDSGSARGFVPLGSFSGRVMHALAGSVEFLFDCSSAFRLDWLIVCSHTNPVPLQCYGYKVNMSGIKERGKDLNVQFEKFGLMGDFNVARSLIYCS